MTINTFWNIFLKILGMFLLVRGIAITFDFYVNTYLLYGNQGAFEGLIVFIFSIIIYIALPFLLIFKSNWLIDVLKLDKGFAQEKIELNGTRATTISIVVILFGGYIVIESLPDLLQQIFVFVDVRLVFRDEYEPAWILFHGFKLLLGYLLMTNSKSIVKIIDRQNSVEKNIE